MSNAAAENAQRAAEIVKSALEREHSDWPAFVAEACGDDADLRAEVESLLSFQREATRFIETPAADIAARLLAENGTIPGGALIEHYRVESLIGTGGMGEVYLATDTKLKRRVALKLVQRGMNTQEILRRFRQEEEILAGLNHPNIAQLYGTGMTADGIPFFAMEYVEGTRLDEFCEQAALGLPDRLQLFRKICSAVSYAHQHLVIHRDLKPANIRVTPDGEPKLLDFGIARILDAATDAAAEQTLTLNRVMTPEYASPEQVRGETMTTASDIYSLGVVLYELLTGRKPYRLTSHRPADVARAITEQTPERPSTAVAAPANDDRRRKIDNPKSLRGDLDNIVLMAMRKEPPRRYASVAQFSDDIRRHLEGRPVVARKDTFGYRTSKFVRRNKAAVAAAALVFLSLAAGIVATTHEARRAQRRFDEVRRLANSLMFEIHDSVQDLPGSTATRRLIVDRALQYLDSLNAEGGADPSLQRELATAYEKVGDIQGNPYTANLGDAEGALASYRKATSIREALAKRGPGKETRLDLGRSYRGLGDIMELKGDIAECLRYYRRSLAVIDEAAAGAPDDSEAQTELARANETLGDGLGRTDATAERLAAYRRNLSIRQRLLARLPEDRRQRRGTAIAYMKVAGVPGLAKEEAVEHMNNCISMLRTLSESDPQNARARREVGQAYYRLGGILTENGDHAAALPNRLMCLEINREIANQDARNQQARFDLATSHGELAETYAYLHEPLQALEHGRESLRLLNELVASDANNAVYRRNLGLCYEHLAAAAGLQGADDNLPRGERVARWSDARDWNRKALEVFTQLRDSRALMPSDAGQIEKFTAKVAEAERALAELQP